MKTLLMAILATGVFGVTEAPATSPRAVSGPTGCDSVRECRGFGTSTADNTRSIWEPRPVTAVAAVRG